MPDHPHEPQAPVDPAELAIVYHPHPVLHRRAEPVDAVTDEVRAVAERMIHLMYDAEGIGLAAPQVALPWRLFVCHVPPFEPGPGDPPSPDATDPGAPPASHPDPLVFINPVITDRSRDLEPMEEGCLSLPGIRGEVRRPTRITMQATGLDGEPFTLHAGGLLARCMQHELDHLDGILILSKFARMDRMKTKREVEALEAKFVRA
ncbi:MAG: peptide deformylase [Planctomycetota bacterium]